jgi:hypothetical protein
MKIFIIVIAFTLFYSNAIRSQSLISTSYRQLKESNNNTSINSNKGNITINLKANYISPIGERSSGKLYGLTCEIQLRAGDRMSYLFTYNPTFYRDDDGKLRHDASIITGGIKFYFEKEYMDFRGYFSISGGIMSNNVSNGGFFVLSPALGFEYFITNEFGLNIEAKPIFSLAPLISFGSGISLNFK